MNNTNILPGEKIRISDSEVDTVLTTTAATSPTEAPILEKEKKRSPVNASIYQKMSDEQKKDFFPVNRAMRRKAGLR